MSDDFDEVKQKIYIHMVGDDKPWMATLPVMGLMAFLDGYRDPEVETLHITEYSPMRDWYLNKCNIANIVVMNLEDIHEPDRSKQPPAKNRKRS